VRTRAREGWKYIYPRWRVEFGWEGGAPPLFYTDIYLGPRDLAIDCAIDFAVDFTIDFTIDLTMDLTIDLTIDFAIHGAGASPVVNGAGAWKERGRGLATHNFQMKFQTAKSDSYTFFPKKVAHFVWEKCRARTTYIVKGVPRKKK
jgi:hypothetical protein